MITLPQPNGSLVLITQSEHASHSAQLAEAWRRPAQLESKCWGHLIDAVRHHDDGWLTTEQHLPLDATGRPYDFKQLPSEYHVAIWRRSIELREQHHPYQALLVAQHARTVHVRYPKPDSDEIQQYFIDELTRRMSEHIRRLAQGNPWERDAIEPHWLAIAQELVSFFDAFSLALLGALEWISQCPPIHFGDQQSVLSLSHGRTDARPARVHPWPFRSRVVQLEARAVHLDDNAFSTSAELHRRMWSANSSRHTWRIEPNH